jgi:ubiquinol-cytochrome c reductase cytochrome b subunit
VKLLKRAWGWLDDRTGLSENVWPIVTHPIPPSVNWLQVLGSSIMVVFGIQIITGIALATVYVPSTDNVYDSLVFITHEARFGSLVRGMHFWGASAMIVLVTLHATRVFLTGSYKYPREMNWLTGAVLLILTFMMAFTGQLLRWDTHSIWSTMVAIRHVGHTPVIGEWLGRFILGGDRIGSETLTRAFAVHVFFIPALIFMMIGAHLYLVIRNGESEAPKPGEPVDPETYRERYEELLEREGVPFWPDAAWRDAVFGMLIVIVIIGIALIVGPRELGQPPDPTVVELEPRPDWYFLWYYALYASLPTNVERIAIVLVPLLTTIWLFSLPFIRSKGERHPLRRPWAVAAVLFVFAAFLGFQEAGRRAPWAPVLDPGPLDLVAVGATTELTEAGAIIYQEKACLACHVIDGVGGTYGPDLSSIGAQRTTGEMAMVIMHGAPNMPAYLNILTVEELDALLAFLATREADPQYRGP